MGKERKIMKIEILRKKPLWELKVIIKALSQPISSFLNTDEDNERLENTRKVLKERIKNENSLKLTDEQLEEETKYRSNPKKYEEDLV